MGSFRNNEGGGKLEGHLVLILIGDPMKTSILLGIAAAALLGVAANAQSPAPTRQDAPHMSEQRTMHGHWRASKLIGVDVYNEQNEKLGDIDELIVDRSGKVAGVVIGVGGFLGLGQRDIFVAMDKLKFVDEPRRVTTDDRAPDANPNRPATTTGASDRAANTARGSSNWYPDHAVLAGASKDSVKNMPEFRYD